MPEMTTTVKERPMIFTGTSPDLVARGLKTQTRRVLRLTGDKDRCAPGMAVLRGSYAAPLADGVGLMWRPTGGSELEPMPPDRVGEYCPYGRVGDRLWVKERWQAWAEFDGVPPGQIAGLSDTGWYAGDGLTRINYLADGNVWKSRRRSPLHMPRWASRTTLEITRVRVQRVRDIAGTDAAAEGVDTADGFDPTRSAPRAKWVSRFGATWESIHGSGAWKRNDWVWCLTFKVLPGRA